MGYFELKSKEKVYMIFRIGIGALYFLFGVQKLLGLWGMPGGAVVFGTLIWYASAGELLIGLGLVTGVLTRLASAFGVIQMIVAYYLGHVTTSGSWNPAANMGVPVLLFLLAFLVTFAYGAGKASLEKKMFKKELF